MSTSWNDDAPSVWPSARTMQSGGRGSASRSSKYAERRLTDRPAPHVLHHENLQARREALDGTGAWGVLVRRRRWGDWSVVEATSGFGVYQ